MKQNIRVHALPTQKASGSIIRKQGNGHFNWEYHEGQYFPQEYLQQIYAKSFHLYATTDETPKEGDWYLDLDGNLFLSWRKGSLGKGCRKVVATSDKDLKIGQLTDGKFDEHHRGLYYLPQISPEFQQAWVKNMNAGIPIVDAVMEMNEIQPNLCDCYYTKFCKSTQLAEGVTCKDQDIPRIYTPKVNSQGYVTILPVKEKMYTSEEVEILCRKAMLMYKGNNEGYPGLIKSSKKKEDKWIEDNL